MEISPGRCRCIHTFCWTPLFTVAPCQHFIEIRVLKFFVRSSTPGFAISFLGKGSCPYASVALLTLVPKWKQAGISRLRIAPVWENEINKIEKSKNKSTVHIKMKLNGDGSGRVWLLSVVMLHSTAGHPIFVLFSL